MKGWKCLFLPNVVVEAELPVQMNGAKRQQFRWAKGSIQCAIKLLSGIIVKRKIATEAKLQAFVQLTRHIVFPLMLIQFLTLPIILESLRSKFSSSNYNCCISGNGTWSILVSNTQSLEEKLEV